MQIMLIARCFLAATQTVFGIMSLSTAALLTCPLGGYLHKRKPVDNLK